MYNNMLKKVTNYHLYILIGIVFILNIILFNAINISKAQWEGPGDIPGEQDFNVLTSPLQVDLDAAGHDILNARNLQLDGDLNIAGNILMPEGSDFFTNLQTLNVYGSDINKEEQVINLNSGWNEISFNIDPSDNAACSMTFKNMLLQIFYDSGLIESIEDIDGLKEYIAIVKTREGVYIPRTDAGSGRLWGCEIGFKIGMWKPAKIIIKGTKIDPGSIDITFSSTWHWAPYLPQMSLPIEIALFDMIDMISIVQTTKNGITYSWQPDDCEITEENTCERTLFHMEPGLSYSIASWDDSLSFNYTSDVYSLSVGDGISTFSNNVGISNNLNVGSGGIVSSGDIYGNNIFANGIVSKDDLEVLSYNLNENENTIYGVTHDSSSGHLLKLQKAELDYIDDEYIPVYDYYDKFTVDTEGNTMIGGDIYQKGMYQLHHKLEDTGENLIYANAEADSVNGNLLLLQNNEVDKFSVTRDGNVGIGTTNPSSKLEVHGYIVSASGASLNGIVYCDGGISKIGEYFKCFNPRVRFINLNDEIDLPVGHINMTQGNHPNARAVCYALGGKHRSQAYDIGWSGDVGHLNNYQWQQDPNSESPRYLFISCDYLP